MPPLPVIEDVYRVALNWDGVNGVSATNVTHWRYGGAGTDPTTVAEELIAEWIANDVAGQYAHTIASSIGTTFEVTPLDGVTATVEGSATSIFGNAAGDIVPSGSVLLKLTSSSRGRSNRGRMYLPFVGEGLQTNGTLVGNAAANVIGPLWETFRTTMAANAWDWVIASYTLGTAVDVVNVTADQTMATQRRRQSRLFG